MVEEQIAAKLGAIEKALETNDRDHKEIKDGAHAVWDAITNIRDKLIPELRDKLFDELKKRPPLWATFIMQVQTGIIGILLTALVAALIALSKK